MDEATKRDKHWAERYNGRFGEIAGAYFGVRTATYTEDTKFATDLVLRQVPGRGMVALRVRCAEQPEPDEMCDWCHKYHQVTWPECRDEFTIRYTRPEDIETEYAKIMKGWCDFLIYAFGNRERDFERYTISDLSVFRSRQSHIDLAERGRCKANHDGSSSFLVFRWDEFPDSFMLRQLTKSDHPGLPIYARRSWLYGKTPEREMALYPRGYSNAGPICAWPQRYFPK